MKKILIIDDNSMIIRSLAMLLNSTGCEIHEAVGGENGLLKYKEINPDVVITDMEMPFVSGEEVITEIRKLKKNQTIIAMSASDKNRSTALNAGATQFYLKPLLHTDVLPYLLDNREEKLSIFKMQT